MEINTDEKGELEFSKVYTPIRIVADKGQPHMNICIRDGGFEIAYNERIIKLSKGEIHLLGDFKLEDDGN